MHEDEVDVDEPLVRRLLAAQMPDLAGRPLAIVEPWGTDNAVWRLRSRADGPVRAAHAWGFGGRTPPPQLGFQETPRRSTYLDGSAGEDNRDLSAPPLSDDLVVRLPRIGWATDQIAWEAEWLPRLAPHLPVALPAPVAVGEPGEGYPFPWAVHRWLPGRGAAPDRLDDPVRFARDLAEVVRRLQAVPTEGAPVAKNRARPLRDYDRSTRRAIAGAAGLIDAAAATAVWEEALAAPPHDGPPVWVQGDLEGNCLVDSDGRLTGIVDWGSACAGDPAVDVQVVWSPLFTEGARRAFLDALGIDAGDPVVTRSRGAAVQQACAALPYYLRTYPLIVERSWHKLAALGIPPAAGRRRT
jgi:aminoglycoside phosphotransferase (APT) family kinase protein